MAKVFRVLSTLLLSACSVNVTPSASPAPSLLPSPLPTTGPASTTTMPEPGTVEGVRADLQTLVTTMERSHVRLFDYVPAAQWQAAVSRLDELVPSLVPGQPERLMVEFMRLVALPGVVGGRHGHIQAWPTTPRPSLGIVTYTFADGVFITRALPAQQDLVGARVTGVAGRPIDEVVSLLEPLIPLDNEWTPELWLIDYLRLPEVLRGVGLIDAVEPLELTVATPDGDSRTVQVPLLGPDDELQPAAPPLSWVSQVDPDFVTLHYLPQREGLLWASRMGEPLWWTRLDDGATLYVQQNLVEPPAGDELATIVEAAGEPSVERVILDLRHNMGGDDASSTISTFRNSAIDRPGRLFIVTSTNVYSAATFIVDELDRFTNAIIVGEPIGGSPGFIVGESTVTLRYLPIPLVVDIPSGSVPPAGANTVMPDIAIPLNGVDYFGGRDPAIEAIREHGND